MTAPRRFYPAWQIVEFANLKLPLLATRCASDRWLRAFLTGGLGVR